MSATVTSTEGPSSIAATAAATSAASGLNGKAKRPALQTPVSASYPSEISTPLSANPANLKRDDSFKTPISPPTAYMDFLKNMSPGLMSPPNTSGSLTRFPSTDSGDSLALTPRERKDSATSKEEETEKKATPEAHPPIVRNASTDSSSSYSTVSSASTESLPSVTAGPSRTKPQSPRIIIPPNHSQFARPHSARTPRRLHIPQSPHSATSVRSPMSARSMQSPYTTSALSAGPWSASFSPRPPYSPRDTDERHKSSKVYVRQTITRTYTYCRTALEPAPRGKRRKTVGSEEPAETEKTPTQEMRDQEAKEKREREQKVKEEGEES